MSPKFGTSYIVERRRGTSRAQAKSSTTLYFIDSPF
jgi:hypothetical protein